MHPVVADRRIGAGRTRPVIVVAFCGQFPVLLQDSNVTFLLIGGCRAGIGRIHHPVGAVAVMPCFIRYRQLFDPGQKASSVRVRHSQELAGAAVQMQRFAAAGIAVRQSIISFCFRLIGSDRLTFLQVFKIQIHQELAFPRLCQIVRSICLFRRNLRILHRRVIFLFPRIVRLPVLRLFPGTLCLFLRILRIFRRSLGIRLVLSIPRTRLFGFCRIFQIILPVRRILVIRLQRFAPTVLLIASVRLLHRRILIRLLRVLLAGCLLILGIIHACCRYCRRRRHRRYQYRRSHQ